VAAFFLPHHRDTTTEEREVEETDTGSEQKEGRNPSPLPYIS